MSENVVTSVPPEADGQAKPAQALVLAILIEVAIVAAVFAILAGSAVSHAAHEAVPLTLVDEDTPKKEEPKPEPPPPKVQPVKQVSKTIAKATPQPPVPVPIVPPPPQAELQSDVQTAFSDPAPAPQPVIPPPPAPSANKGDKTEEYAGKVHDAVQAAYFYPPAAASMHFSGRVRVAFVLKDQHVTEAHIAQTCGIGLFDKAALQAVQNARYPQPPEQLRGQDLHYQIWVELSTR